MLCEICKGEIGAGEPVVSHGDGVAHRFSTTCAWFREQIERYDEEVRKDAGIKE